MATTISEIPSPPVTRAARTRTATISGVEWSCSDAGEGGTAPLLMLPGAMGMVDAGGAVLARLAEGRRVLGLAYPRVETMTALCDGIAALLDELGVERADVLGSSLGGYVAQCLVRRHPGRVRHLVLSHTYTLRPADAGRLRFGVALFGRVPAWLYRALLRARLRRALAPLRERRPADYARWMDDGSLFANLTPDAVSGYNRWMIESLDLFRFAPGDLDGHDGRVLIVEAEDDPIIHPRARAALRALYPAATVRTFHGTGHATSLVAPVEYADAIRDFL
jgi:pimeloyl-ACP methyl ester carboxylesterase